jgi:hypothetical protein
MGIWNRFVNAVCWWLTRTFPGRYRIIGDNGTPYLGRFYVKKTGRLPGLYLHHFYRSDQDRELHNHPWVSSSSVVLTGGYYEERWESKTPINKPGFVEDYKREAVRMIDRSAPGFNRIFNTTFHRVVLKDLKNGAWTLFIPGPEAQDWGFLDRTTGKYTPHADFLGKMFLDIPPVEEERMFQGVRTGRLRSDQPNLSATEVRHRLDHEELQRQLIRGRDATAKR